MVTAISFVSKPTVTLKVIQLLACRPLVWVWYETLCWCWVPLCLGQSSQAGPAAIPPKVLMPIWNTTLGLSSLTVADEYSPTKTHTAIPNWLLIRGNISFCVPVTLEGVSSHILLPTKTSVTEYLNVLGHFCIEGRKADFTQLPSECWNSKTEMYQDHAWKGKMKGLKQIKLCNYMHKQTQIYVHRYRCACNHIKCIY